MKARQAALRTESENRQPAAAREPVSGSGEDTAVVAAPHTGEACVRVPVQFLCAAHNLMTHRGCHTEDVTGARLRDLLACTAQAVASRPAERRLPPTDERWPIPGALLEHCARVLAESAGRPGAVLAEQLRKAASGQREH